MERLLRFALVTVAASTLASVGCNDGPSDAAVGEDPVTGDAPGAGVPPEGPEPVIGDGSEGDPAEIALPTTDRVRKAGDATCAPKTCSGASCSDFTATGEVALDDTPKAHGAPATVVPYPPITRRVLRLGEEGEKGGPGRYTRPVVPAFRTTTDGRVALVRNQLRALHGEDFVNVPITQHAANLGATVFSQGGRGLPLDAMKHASVRKSAQWELSPQFICEDGKHHVEACGDDDCYRATIISHLLPGGVDEDNDDGAAHPMRVQGTPVRIRVAHPKTRAAAVVSIDVLDDDAAGWSIGPELNLSLMAETIATADGHVMIGRLSDSTLGLAGVEATYRLDDPTKTNKTRFSLFYAYADTPCDAGDWTAKSGAVLENIRPIAAAPFDRRMKKGGYGFAARPIRDVGGRVLGELDALAGSYPWMDREGHNLFFTTSNPIGVTDRTGTLTARFPIAKEGGGLGPIGSAPRGVSVMGSWTQGKVVTLDGIVNNDDYGINPGQTHRLGLYQSGGKQVSVRVDGGGKNDTELLRIPNAKSNNHHMESLENVFAMHEGSLAVTPRDVVWTVSRGLASDEITFDDFTDPHVVLFAEMNAAETRNEFADQVTADKAPLSNARNNDYADGFVGTANGFDHVPSRLRLQNAAASAVFPLAEAGRVEGNARVEPVALGGVRGRGLWLEPDARMTFAFPASTSANGFYVGMFVDARDDMSARRRLFRLDMANGVDAVVDDAGVFRIVRNGAELAAFDASCLVGSWLRRWHHVGFVFGADGTITFFLDGNAIGTSAVVASPVRLAAGTLVVGGASGGDPSIRGWYDEVRVVVEGDMKQLSKSASIELLCNYARGTAVAVQKGSALRPAANLTVFAQKRVEAFDVVDPSGAPTFCAVDYRRDYLIGARKLPAKTTSRRDVLVHEGRRALTATNMRPSTQGVSFCASCHVDEPGRPKGLSFGALTAGTVDVPVDPHTQPFQPFSPFGDVALAYGVIPKGWIRSQGGDQLPARRANGPVPVMQYLLRQ